MNCSICNTTHDLASGAFSRHLKKIHLLSRDEYYYKFHDADPCVICGNNKRIKDWNYIKADTCGSLECAETNRKLKLSIKAKERAKNGTHNFQTMEARTSSSTRMKSLSAKGEHPSQTKEARERISKSTTERNILNNPMRNLKAQLKSSKSHTGKVLSKVHKKNISDSMYKFIISLTHENFDTRMENTLYMRTPIDLLLGRENYNVGDISTKGITSLNKVFNLY